MATAHKSGATNEPANPATENTEITASPEGAPADDMRRRYLEALDRKRAGGAAAATGHGADRATTPTSNDKVKRTFRRRAGG